MTRADELRALLARVEAASGPDRELDYDIPRAVFPKPSTGFWTSDREYYEPLTGSIDAAVSLVEKVLPGWEWNVALYNGDTGQACIRKPGGDEPEPLCFAASPCLAILAALIRALQADQTDAGGRDA